MALCCEIISLWCFPITFLLFLVISKIFLKFPRLLHKKKNGNFSIFHISHRGGAGEDTENTIQSFQNAFNIRTDMFETDVHLTKDGQVVTIHDQELLRLFNSNTKVSDYEFKDLPEFTKPLPLSFPSKAFKTHCLSDKFPKKVLLLEELFETFPKTMINIDIKINNDELIDKVYRLIKKYKLEEYIIWGSFNHAIFRKLKPKYPDIQTFCSFTDALKTIFFFNIGLLPFIPINYEYFEFPLFSIIIYNVKLLLLQLHHLTEIKLLISRKLNKRSSDFDLIPRYSKTINRIRDAIIFKIAFNRNMFKHLNDRGIPVLMWVANSVEEFDEALVKYKANGVMTDFPNELSKYLNDRPEICNNKKYNVNKQD